MLDRVFGDVRDIVWLCDHYAGINWAVNRVRKETLDAIGPTPTVDNTHWFVD